MKSKKNINKEILVGLFLFAMIIALSVFTIILGGSKVLTSQYNYEIIFNWNLSDRRIYVKRFKESFR